MHATDKRHPCHNRYRLAIDSQGIIQGGEITVIGDCGYSPDLSDAIVDRATDQGCPFYYYAFGAAVAEVSVDTLSGEY